MSVSIADLPELFRHHSAELRTSMPSYRLLTRFRLRILMSPEFACGQSSDLVFGMEVHKKMIKNYHIQMDLSLCNAVIGLYAKCGSLDYARVLFDEMSEKDSVTYGAIISGYMAHGLVKEAMALFSEMENIGLSTWNAVISGLMQNNHHEEVIKSFREMI